MRSNNTRRSSAASVLLGGAGITTAALTADARSVKDGVFVGAESPLTALVSTAQGAVRVHTFLAAVDRICQSYAATTAANRPQWFQHEFRAVCEAAVPVAAELSSRALVDADATPVNVTAFLDALSCHVSMNTKEKLQKLQYTARMVGRRHEAPSSRATAGTPAVGRPAMADFPASPAGGSRSLAAFPSAPVETPSSSSQQQPPAPAQGAAGGKRERPAAPDPALQRAPSQPKATAESAAAGATTNATNAAAARPITSDKLNVIMPWTIPAPHQEGVVLRRVRPRTFKAATGAKSSSAAPGNGSPMAARPSTAAGGDGGASGPAVPTVQDVAAAVGTPHVYELWSRREAAMKRLATRADAGGAAAAQARGNADDAEKSKRSDGAAAPPGPVFPHVAAHRNGLAGPSGIGDDAANTSTGGHARHTTVRKSFLTALAHYGVHWVRRGSTAAAAGQGES